MKLVTFEIGTPVGRMQRLGGLLDGSDSGRIVDLHSAFVRHLTATDEPTPEAFAALRLPSDMIGWLRAGRHGLAAAETAMRAAAADPSTPGPNGERVVFERREVKLLAPLPKPASFRDFSIYEEHMQEAPKRPTFYTHPAYYKGSTTAIAGPEDPVPWPYYTKLLDLELEIGIVIGKQGSNLSIEEAAGYIAGYTILVDSSAREGRDREYLGPTKRKDWHTALGPFLVTPDEVDIENVRCTFAVDGEVWYEGSTGAPHSFSPAHLVAYTSDSETVYPGDLLGTGTIGASCSSDSGRWIKSGQTATFTIDGLGSMSLKVVDQPAVVIHVGNGMRGLLPTPANLAAR
jgi:2-keto-4-pentenoate hydratase/2-oxohepta-3-ene-1,7-dioic acid hydratase in catechol pathway